MRSCDMLTLVLALLLLAAAAASPDPAATAPQAQITNGVITAKILLPDPEKGYYRGTRFDWSGQIASLKANGHEYFGIWFPKYDPKLHDAILGPVEEFLESLGYDEAKAGDKFVRIGVGAVRRGSDAEFQRFGYYPIVDFGNWSTHVNPDHVVFTHRLKDTNGYAYEYTKTLRLVVGRPEMRIEHTLRNTGKKPIRTSQYNHNFLMFDGKPTGPDASVTFASPLKVTKDFEGGLAEVRGNRIVFLKDIPTGASAFAELEASNPYDIRLEHKGAGAAVRITADQPMSKLVFWAIKTTFCPEPYIAVSVDPGAEMRWTLTYDFE